MPDGNVQISPLPIAKRAIDLGAPHWCNEFNAENLMHFIDWNRSEPYKVERGEGECAV